MKQRESVVLRECLSCLAHHNFDVVPPRTHYLFPWREGAKGIIWRSNTGGGWHIDKRTGRMGKRPVYFGLPGSPDLVGIMAGNGRMIGVEVKSKDGRLSGNQIIFQEWMNKAGGIYIVARSYEECDAGLKRYGI